MNYELAKHLKDAGFPDNPFRKKEMCPCSDATIEKDGMWECQCKEFIQEPTLSELIEASNISSLRVNDEQWGGMMKGGWIATSWNGKKGEGKTPEESVAKLWLELNKA